MVDTHGLTVENVRALVTSAKERPVETFVNAFNANAQAVSELQKIVVELSSRVAALEEQLKA